MFERLPAADLVPVPEYGVQVRLLLRIRELVNDGRLDEALAEIDVYEWVAGAFGDQITVEHMIQRRMYTYLQLQQYEPALTVGGQLVARRRANGDVLGEAKTLADLAELCLLTGRLADGMRYLARCGLLLEGTNLRNRRYISALASYGDAAMAAGLYETAAAFYDAFYANCGSDAEGYLEDAYTKLLVSWGLWLDHLGRPFEAAQRLRRAATIAGNWLAVYRDEAAPADVDALIAVQAVGLAKSGEIDQAVALAQPLIAGAGSRAYARPGMWMAHLVVSVGLRAGGDYRSAHRELLAAQHLATVSGTPDDLLLVQHELATLNAEALGREACRELLAAVQKQAQLVWAQRSQRLAMLHQARQREELELAHAQTSAALLADPLTGLGNRRHFDQVTAAVHAGAVPVPLSLLIIDVDDFKAVNDTCSHSAGDQVLREIAGIIGGHCRAGVDTPIRYAGDEFVVFLNSDLVAAAGIAERIRAAVRATRFDRVAPNLSVSISTGVAALRAGMTVADLFRAADDRLYQAKRAGRNRVVA